MAPPSPPGANALTASLEGAPALSFLNLLGNRAIGAAPFLDLSSTFPAPFLGNRAIGEAAAAKLREACNERGIKVYV